jgi:hypothetical protein
MPNELVPIEIIENKIFVIRGKKVMMDSDLAMLYDVETKVLNQAVKRNLDRFPEDFMFQISDIEWDTLRSQFVTSTEVKGGRRFKPFVFTEHGILMLSSVLNSKRALAVNIQIMRTFVKLRQIVFAHKELARELKDLEKRFISYAKDTTLEQQEQEQKINEIFKQLEYLNNIHKPTQIGFKTE